MTPETSLDAAGLSASARPGTNTRSASLPTTTTTVEILQLVDERKRLLNGVAVEFAVALQLASASACVRRRAMLVRPTDDTAAVTEVDTAAVVACVVLR